MSDKFRPVNWADISKPKAPIVGWGVERKEHGKRRYIPIAYNGEIHPFKTRAEAQAVCDDLNLRALAGAHDA